MGIRETAVSALDSAFPAQSGSSGLTGEFNAEICWAIATRASFSTSVSNLQVVVRSDLTVSYITVSKAEDSPAAGRAIQHIIHNKVHGAVCIVSTREWGTRVASLVRMWERPEVYY